jgi:DNA-binding XRE family transcriptional regulator
MTDEKTEPQTNIPSLPRPTPEQIRAARNYFGWNQDQAAEKFEVGRTTLSDLERGDRKPWGATQEKIGVALLRHGIRFDGADMILPPVPPT